MAKIIKLNVMSGGRNDVTITEQYINADKIIRFYRNEDESDVKFWGRVHTIIQLQKGELTQFMSVTDSCEEIMEMING